MSLAWDRNRRHTDWQTPEQSRQWEEQDDEEQKEALRAFHERERGNPYISPKDLIWFFCKCCLWAAAIALVVIGWMAL